MHQFYVPIPAYNSSLTTIDNNRYNHRNSSHPTPSHLTFLDQIHKLSSYIPIPTSHIDQHNHHTSITSQLFSFTLIGSCK
ncbi:hypothetical protein LINPERPRIM_LOCUS22178, partial [Linum perenne]